MVRMNTKRSYFAAMLLFSLIASSTVVGQTSTKVRATTLEPASQAAYIFELNFDSDVSPTSHIEIIFPPSFNLNGATMAASDKIDGMLSVKREKSSLIIQRIKAQTPIPAGDVVDLKVATILNPNEMRPDWEFRVIVHDGERDVEQKVLSTAIEQLTKENR